ncbi:three component ABC system middle component [Streptomyces sp. NPDC001536]|uniref:three component ABC system middle component n=1 Tax=Streptomyces sp. NPDC001536 TaxID=3364583 RepID=UPI0036ACD917
MTTPDPLHRSAEAQALLNPAFGAYLLAHSIYAAQRKKGQPMPWPSAFLVLPLVLPAKARDSLPGNSTVSLMAWADKNPLQHAAFAERAVSLTNLTRMSLRMAMRHQAVEVTPLGLRCPRKPMTAPDFGQEVAECARAAALVGRWLAATDPHRAYTALGVRP